MVYCLVLAASFIFCFIQTQQVDAEQPHLVFLIAEQEYQTEETLPAFCKQYLQKYKVSFVYALPDDPNTFADIELVDSADLLFVSVRRRTLPPQQLNYIRRHVQASKPVIGIRTASHAFCLRNEDPPKGLDAWPEFDRAVFGGNYTNHYKNQFVATIQSVQSDSLVVKNLLSGIKKDLPFESGGSLYRVSPLEEKTEIILHGVVEEYAPEPVAWTFRRADGGKSFYTSLGHLDDFHGPVLPRLLANAIEWCLHE